MKRRRWLAGLVAAGVLVAFGLWLLGGDPRERTHDIASEESAPRRAPELVTGRRPEPSGSDAPEEKAAEPANAPASKPNETGETRVVTIVGAFRRAGTQERVAIGDLTVDWTPALGGKRNRTTVTPNSVGTFEIEVPTDEVITLDALWTTDPRWRFHAWYPEGGKVGDAVRATPSAPIQVVIEVAAMIQLKGVVLDPERQPLAGVRISYATPHPNGSEIWAGMMTTTGPTGEFTIRGMLAIPRAILGEKRGASASRIRFERSGFTSLVVDAQEVDEVDRPNWQVVMSRGLQIGGTLVNPSGRSLAGVAVEAAYDDPAKRRTAVTDAAGRFALTTLSEGKLSVRALALEHDLEARKDLMLNTSIQDLELVAETIVSDQEGVIPVMGLRLSDTDEASRKKLGLPEHARVTIVDPGANSARLGIGPVRPGYGIWKIGQQDVTSVKQFIELILAEHEKALKRNPRFPTVRIVYVYGGQGDRAGWSNTQHMMLRTADVESLRRTAETLR